MAGCVHGPVCRSARRSLRQAAVWPADRNGCAVRLPEPGLPRIRCLPRLVGILFMQPSTEHGGRWYAARRKGCDAPVAPVAPVAPSDLHVSRFQQNAELVSSRALCQRSYGLRRAPHPPPLGMAAAPRCRARRPVVGLAWRAVVLVPRAPPVAPQRIVRPHGRARRGPGRVQRAAVRVARAQPARRRRVGGAVPRGGVRHELRAAAKPAAAGAARLRSLRRQAPMSGSWGATWVSGKLLQGQTVPWESPEIACNYQHLQKGPG